MTMASVEDVLAHYAHEPFYVAGSACKECIYTPERLLSDEKTAQAKQILENNQCPLECICCTVAQHRGLMVPDVHCYAQYYLTWHTNPYLRALKEAGLVRFYDISALPGMRETHMSFYGDPVLSMKQITVYRRFEEWS